MPAPKKKADPFRYEDLTNRARLYLRNGRVPDVVRGWPTGLGADDEWQVDSFVRALGRLFSKLPRGVTADTVFCAGNLTPKCMIVRKVGARPLHCLECNERGNRGWIARSTHAFDPPPARSWASIGHVARSGAWSSTTAKGAK